jgi:hypothetical protein
MSKNITKFFLTLTGIFGLTQVFATEIYSNNLKSGILTTSASQQILGLHARLVLAQWSLALDTKICAASLFKFQTSSCWSI